MNEQELQQVLLMLQQAAALGDERAKLALELYRRATEENDQLAGLQFMLVVQQLMQSAGGGDLVAAARFGAKVEYIKKLRGICPEGTKTEYFKAGGRVCKRCALIAPRKQASDPIEAFRCGRKTKRR